MIKVEQDYLNDLVMSICHKGNPIKSVTKGIEKGFGGLVGKKNKKKLGQIAGGLTGGIVGNDPNKEAIREARRQEEMTRKRIDEEQQAREREEQFSKEVSKDKQSLQDAEGKRITRAKPELVTDFTKAIKGKKEEEDDKLKKLFKKAFRG